MVGRVNAYLIEDSPLTLIDSGPNSAKALDELEQALATRGHTIEDIELLVISHQHIDHFGLASILARRSGAEVAALDGPRTVPRRLRPPDRPRRPLRRAPDAAPRHPAEIVTALRAVSASFRAWGSAVEVTRPLADGSELRLRDRTLRVLHRPGHSPSDTVFLDESPLDPARGRPPDRAHLLQPAAGPPAGRPGRGTDAAAARPQALVTYIDSLAEDPRDGPLARAPRSRPADHRPRVADRRALPPAPARAEKIHRLIASQPRTAHEIAQELWGNVAVTQAYLTLSEVLGHVDLLLRDGSVVEQEDAGVVRFQNVN